MQIACPSCAATYELPAARLKPGRSVRCSACGAEWKPEPEPEPQPDPAAPPPAEPAAQPMLTALERLAARAPEPTRSPALLAAWLLTVLLLGGGGVSAVVWRVDVMRLWPPSSRILAVFDRMPEKPAVISGKTP
nr:zinc-ribbon domain-containing protein [uncultured Rhodopila sp.]